MIMLEIYHRIGRVETFFFEVPANALSALADAMMKFDFFSDFRIDENTIVFFAKNGREYDQHVFASGEDEEMARLHQFLYWFMVPEKYLADLAQKLSRHVSSAVRVPDLHAVLLRRVGDFLASRNTRAQVAAMLALGLTSSHEIMGGLASGLSAGSLATAALLAQEEGITFADAIALGK